jgi:hypothetical protein
MIRAVVGTLYLLVHGCDTVSGGAVELSWKLRPASSSLPDKFVDCASAQRGAGTVTGIRLHWQVNEPDGGASGSSQVWPCELNHGVTRFDLAEGTANLWITPECGVDMGQDADPATYIAPASVQRKVLRGDTVSLGAVELVVSVSYCDRGPDNVPGVPVQPCICCFDPPCN